MQIKLNGSWKQENNTKREARVIQQPKKQFHMIHNQKLQGNLVDPFSLLRSIGRLYLFVLKGALLLLGRLLAAITSVLA